VLFVKYAILALAVGATLVSKRWGLAIFAFFLPLTQWLPDTHVPGLNALNLMLIPLIIRSAMAGSAPAAERGEPLMAPWVVMFACWTISWIVVQNAPGLPAMFVENGGIYDNFITFKEFVVDIVIYYCARRLTRDDEAVRRITSDGALRGISAGRESDSKLLLHLLGLRRGHRGNEHAKGSGEKRKSTKACFHGGSPDIGRIPP
jgi:hypothetical protein